MCPACLWASSNDSPPSSESWLVGYITGVFFDLPIAPLCPRHASLACTLIDAAHASDLPTRNEAARAVEKKWRS